MSCKSFLKLFNDADNIVGLNHTNKLVQYDTSKLDNDSMNQELTEEIDDNDDNITNSNNKSSDDTKTSITTFIDDNIDRLRSTICHIYSNQSNPTVKYLINEKQMNKNYKDINISDIIKAYVQSYNWESEVHDAMKLDLINQNFTSKITINKANQLSKYQPIEISTFRCINPDMIDRNDISDKYDIIIPNIDSYDDYDDSNSFNQTFQSINKIITSNNTSSINVINISENSVSINADSNVKPTETIESNDNVKPTFVSTSITGNKNLTSAERKQLLALEKANRLRHVNLGGEAAASLEHIFAFKKHIHDDFSSSGKRRGRQHIVSTLNHISIALLHKNTKPDLKEIELKYFHKPKLRLLDVKNNTTNWYIYTKLSTPKSKDNKISNITSFDKNSKQNVSLLEGNFILIEYIEENPMIIQNYGMASVLINYYRNQKDINNDDNNPITNNDNSGSITNNTQYNHLVDTLRLPRHVKLLLKQRNNKSLFSNFDNTSIPKSDIGETMPLAFEEDSPFLGNIEPNESQLALVNNLFKSPLFKQTIKTNYFLLIPIIEKKNSINNNQTNSNPNPDNTEDVEKPRIKYLIRQVQKVFISGQLEPQKIIPKPSEQVTKTQENFYLLAASRFFQSNMTGVEFNRFSNFILKYCSRVDRAPHKYLHREKLKTIIRQVASEERDGSYIKWYPKEYPTIDTERQFSPEELSKLFNCEDVCLQEACNAYEYKLRELGITDLDTTKLDTYIQRLSKSIDKKEERLITLKYLYSKHTSLYYNDLDNVLFYERLIVIFTNEIKKLYNYLQTAKFIFHHLLNAPWNLSETFVKTVIEKDKSYGGYMEVSYKLVEPSGIGEGFAYKRVFNQATSKTTSKNERLQGTDGDLRSLTKKKQLFLLSKLGVDPEQCKTLKRWDLINLIRHLCNKAAMKGQANALQKFVRMDGVFGAALNLGNYKRLCQEIWNKQKYALQYIPSKKNITYQTAQVKSNDFEDVNILFDKSIKNKEIALLEMFKNHRNNDVKEKHELENILHGIEESKSTNNTTNNNKSKIQAKVNENTTLDNNKAVDLNPISNITINTSKPIFPKRVVKEVSRIYRDDGNQIIEIISIKFLISDSDIKRVETNQIKQMELDKNNKNKSKKYVDMTRHDDNIDEDDYQRMPLNSTGTLGLNVSALKRKASEALSNDNNQNDDNYIYRQTITPRSTKRQAQSVKTYRLPRVALNSRFEEFIMELWHLKKAHVFWYPVNQEVKGYYEMIKNPMSLMEIREKIINYKYTNSSELLEDIRLMASNAELYNGKGSEIAKSGWRLEYKLRTLINHEKDHFGIDRDTITILEDAIMKKSYYKQSSNQNNINIPVKSTAKPPVNSNTSAPSIPIHQIETINHNQNIKSDQINSDTNTITTSTLSSNTLDNKSVKVNPSVHNESSSKPTIQQTLAAAFNLSDSDSGDEEVLEEG